MIHVFERSSIAGITLQNRIIRSATYDQMGDHRGLPTERMLNLYKRLARNNVGAIITGYAAVQQNGRTTQNMLLIDSDECVENFKTLSATVREHNVPIILQLAHGGGQCLGHAANETVAPSSLPYKMYKKHRP